MKLYLVPPNSKIQIQENKEILVFHHIDGVYSLCTDGLGHIVHLSASTEVDVLDKNA